MPMRVQASRFEFVSGAGREGAANLLAVEKGNTLPAVASRGNLYVLVEPLSRPAGYAQVVAHTLQLIRKTYYEGRGPATSGLRAALQAANDYLFQRNLDSSPAEQVDLAVCCVVLRGSEALIGRVGPCAIYHIHDGRWQRLPASEAEGGSSAAPLGLRKGPEIGFSAASLAPGDVVLLMESRGASALAPAGVKGPTSAAVTAALRSAAQKVDFSALLIELSGEGAPAEAPAQPARRRRAAKPADAEAAEAEPAPVSAPPHPAPPFRPSVGAILLLALLIPLFVAGAVLGYNWYRARQIEASFRQSFEAAVSHYNTARATSDKEVAKDALNKAQALLREAQTIHSDDQAVVRLGKDIQALDDKLRLVKPIYWMTELYRFTNPNSAPRRLAVAGRDLYVLDAGNSVVTRHRLNEVGDGLERGQEIAEVVRKGQPAGNLVVGNLIDVLWMPADGNWQQAGLLILDASGRLIVYNSKTATLSAQVLSGALKTPLALGSYTGARLYVLDPGAGQIFRYTPAASAYTGAPDPYFPAGATIDLLAARDMAIDGDIWLLYSDRVERFQRGAPVAFQLRDLDRPFSSPAGIFTAPEDGANPVRHLYISDTGNGRILKIAKDGRFVRQFRPPEGRQFTEIHDLYVDETRGKLYFVAGVSLYLADLPQDE